MTETNIAQGNEISHAYSSQLTNAELLNQYGFVLDQNPNMSRVSIQIALQNDDLLFEEKSKYIETSKTFGVRQFGERKVSELLDYLRVKNIE